MLVAIQEAQHRKHITQHGLLLPCVTPRLARNLLTAESPSAVHYVAASSCLTGCALSLVCFGHVITHLHPLNHSLALGIMQAA